MTKKHFEAMADYVADKQRQADACELMSHEWHVQTQRANGAYQLAVYLGNKFGERFDRARFDAWIEKKANTPCA